MSNWIGPSSRLPLLATVALLGISCAEQDPTSPEIIDDRNSAPEQLVTAARFDCTIDGAAETMDCSPYQPDTSYGASAVIHLGQTFAELSSGQVFEGSDGSTGDPVLLAEVALTNVSGQTIGVAADSRVWFFEGPTPTSSGTVSVRQPDGTDTFTGSEPKPYYSYPDDLAPGQTSANKFWQFDVSSHDITFTFSVYVEVALDENVPLIGTVSPDVLEPGDIATIAGFNFSPTLANNLVSIDGVSATVTAATATELTVEVPALNPPDCAVRGAPVEVTVGSHPTATQAHSVYNRTSPHSVSAMGVGDFVNLSTAAEVGCGFDLPVNSGEEYFLSVHSVSTDRNTSVGFRLEGSLDGPAMVASTTPDPARTLLREHTLFQEANDVDDEALRAHIEALLDGRDLYQRVGAPSGTVAAAAPPSAGDTLELVAPNGDTIDARAVYSPGTKVVVFQDTGSQNDGLIDTELTRLGQEYFDRMEGILQTYFGNPLAFDENLDNNGVIYIVFSPTLGTTPGLVRTCDFNTACSTSNAAEIAWILGPEGDDVSLWERQVQPTIMHETKHVTSIAEDQSRGQPLEEIPLEEATASLAQELWEREVHSIAQGSNATWDDGPKCLNPFNPLPSGCAEGVSGTQGLFAQLYDHLARWETETQFGFRGYYYLYWWFVRWSVDHYGGTESTFFKSLVQEGTLTGIDNLLDKLNAGTFAELVGQFTLATMTDDLSGFTPTLSAIDHPSWNSRDIFANLGRTDPFPILPTQLSFGTFTPIDVSSVGAGSALIFDLQDFGSVGGGTQTILPYAPGTNDPVDPLIRMSIVRVQ